MSLLNSNPALVPGFLCKSKNIQQHMPTDTPLRAFASRDYVRTFKSRQSRKHHDVRYSLQLYLR